MAKQQQELWSGFGGKGIFARMAENAKNDGDGNEISQTYATKDEMSTALGGKADKVTNAVSGNLASLDASGNLANSGKKVADFKTKQTAVTDPAADGFGLSFIDSVSQNANGELTPHKKTVQDGSTVQKGVVQLQDSVGSTESTTDKAVTPHAVRAAIDSAVSSAYHAAGTKTVAQLTGSLLIAANAGDVYNMTDSGTTTADFVEGAGHPINAGDNVGVCDVGGGVYKFDLLSGFVDLSNYLTKTGDASDTTSTFTKASGDASSMTSGSKLSAIFTAISNVFASFKALAFKDTVGTSDIADDAITAAKVKDNETLPVNISGRAASATSLAPGGTSGQYLKSNGNGNAPSWDNTSSLSVGVAYNLPYAYRECGGSQEGTNNSALLATIAPPAASSNSENKCFFDILLTADSAQPTVKFSVSLCVRANSGGYYWYYYRIWKKNTDIPLDIDVKYDSSSKNLYLIVRRKVTTSIYCGCTAILRTATGWNGVTLYAPTWLTLHKNSAWSDLSGLSNASKTPNTVGSDTQPVYMDADGSMKACGFQVNFGTPIAGANVLNIITA